MNRLLTKKELFEAIRADLNRAKRNEMANQLLTAEEVKAKVLEVARDKGIDLDIAEAFARAIVGNPATDNPKREVDDLGAALSEAFERAEIMRTCKPPLRSWLKGYPNRPSERLKE